MAILHGMFSNSVFYFSPAAGEPDVEKRYELLNITFIVENASNSNRLNKCFLHAIFLRIMFV